MAIWNKASKRAQQDSSKTATARSRLRMQALEPRVMFDGALAATAAQVQGDALHSVAERAAVEAAARAPQAERLADAREALAALTARPADQKQVVFVDASVAQYRNLLAQIPPGMDLVVLQPGRDGLGQIADWAKTHQGYAAIHILSHGQSGDLILGSTDLTTAALDGRQAELRAIGQALTQDGDILLYGCSIGAGSTGAAFVGALARYTQADVAASTDATGAARLGGNWTLERSSGPIDVAGLDLGYDALLTRPITGVTDFGNRDGANYGLPAGTSSYVIPDVNGWDFTMQLGANFNGNQTVDVSKLGSVSITTVNFTTDGSIPIAYMEGKPNDGSRFTLNSIGVVVSGYDGGITGGNLQLVGYVNGQAVSGAVLVLNVGDAVQNNAPFVVFNVSGNAAFQGIDSFQVTAVNGHSVLGLIGIGAIDAIDFGFAPTLTASGGASAYSSGTGTPVVVDNGITLSDSDSSTQASATVSITGNFRSGEDVLAFVNNNSTTYGNIVASYNSGTGVLSLSSAGKTATLAQWQAALRAVTYQDSSLSPNTGNRTISFAINDGLSTSLEVTKTLTVAADAAPVLGNLNGDSATFTEKGGPVKLDVNTAATVTDSDTPNFNNGNLTVHVSANGQASQDVLGVDTSGTVSLSNGTNVGSAVLVGGVTVGVIASNGDGLNGHDLVISFGSNATPPRVATLVRALTYSNSNTNDPSAATRTINVSVNDGRGGTGSANVTVAIAAVNDAPTASATASNPTFTMNGAAVTVFSGASVSAVEASQSVTALTLSVSGLLDGSSEILSVDGSNVALVNGNSVTTSGNGLSVTVSVSGGTATVTLTSSGISGSTAASVINGITYRDSNANATQGNRVVTLTSVKDSGGTSNGGVDTTVLALASTVRVAVVPVVTTSGGSTAFVAGDNTASTPVVVDGGITVTDAASSTLASGTVRISGNFQAGEDVLAFSNTNSTTYGNIVASYNAGTGVLTLTSAGSTATLAQWQAALRAVTYTDTAVTPQAATRTISFQVNNGSDPSATVVRSVTVTPVDQTPIATTSGGSAAFTAGDNAASTPVAVDPGLTLSDLDNATLASATVSITGNFQSGQDVLGFSNSSATTYGNIVASYNAGTGVLTLTSSGATATLAQWQAALRAVSYTDTAVTPNTATRTVSFQVNDGTKSSAVVSRSVSVTATDQTPIATTSGGSAAFTAGDNTASTPVLVDSGITVSDLDSSTLLSARVSITGNFQSGQDVLAFSNTNSTSYGNIVASYNAATGVLTLSSAGGTATLAQWQAALRAVSYTDTAVTPNTATRTLSFQVNDGVKDSAVATRTLTVAATDQTPILGASGGSGSFTVGGAAVPVDGGLTLSDRDSSTLASARVAISGNFHSGEDVLGFVNNNSTLYGNIVASYNAGTGVLTLTSSGATATLAQWQAALRAVSYTDTAATPNMATRTFSVEVNDGSKTSAAVSRSVAMALPAPGIAGLTAGTDTGSSASDGITGNNAPTVAGTAVAGSLVTIYVDGVAVDTTLANGSGAWSYSFATPLNDGTHAILVQASLGGVNSAPSTSLQVTMDTASPNAPVVTGLSSATDTGSSASDGLTGNNQPVIVGTAEAGSAVTVYVDGVAVGTTTANGSGAWSYALSTALADGSHSLRATAADLAGNVSGPSTALNITVDTAAPNAPMVTGLSSATDTGSSASDGITGNNQPVIVGTAEAGSTVTVYVDGVSVGTTTANGSGAWSHALSTALADGHHSLRATATDASGNVSGLSAARSITVDTASPTAPVVTGLSSATDTGSSASDGITGNNQPVIVGTAEAGSTVTVYVDGVAVGTTTANGSGAWSYALSTALADGHHSLRATATDVSGNVSGLSATRSITVDTAAPNAPVVTGLSSATDTGSSAGDGITGNNQPVIVGTAEAGSTVTVYVDGVAVGTTTADGSGAWRYALSTALADGHHSLRATATDVAGNVSGLSATRSITVDTAAPNAPVVTGLSSATDTGSSASDGITANTQPVIVGTAEAGSTVTVYVDGLAVGTTTADGSGAWSYALSTALADGHHSLRATATDVSGNVSGLSATRSITVDTAAPNAPVVTGLSSATDTGSSAGDGITGNNQPVIVGTAEAGSTVTVYVDGVAVGTTTADGSGAWSYALSTALADGHHSLRAMATDAAGNVSAPSAVRNITVDTAAPNAPVVTGLSSATDTGSNASDGLTGNNQPVIVGTAEAGSTVTVYVDGVAVGTTTADGSGAWRYALSMALADGHHSLRATATDVSGNVSGPSAVRSITVDTAAPNAPVVTGLSSATDTGSSASDGITANTQPVIVGTAEAGSTVTVYVDGLAVGTTMADGSGAWRYALSTALADGKHGLSAVATDAAGNVSAPSATRTLAVDSVAPGAPVVTGLSPATDTGSSSSDGLTGNARPVIVGTAEAGSTVTVYVDGVAVGTTTADGRGAWSYALNTALADGRHSLSAVATDAAGNVSAPSLTRTLAVDSVAPNAPVVTGLSPATDTGSSSSDGLTGNARPVVVGTAEAGSTVTVYVDGVAVGTAMADDSGAWRYALSAALADGTHGLQATATDAAGNVSVPSSAGSVTVDTRAPNAPVVTGLSADTDTGSSHSDGVTRHPQPVIVGTAEAGSRVTVIVDGVAVGTTMADSRGVWRYALNAALVDGRHDLSASATDAAGNVSAPAASLGITVDTVAPRLQSVQALGERMTSADILSYELVFSKPLSGLATEALELVSSGTAQGRIASIEKISEGRYVVTLTGVHGDGDLAIALKADAVADVAGNRNAQRVLAPAYQVYTPVVPLSRQEAEPIRSPVAVLSHLGPMPSALLDALAGLGHSRLLTEIVAPPVLAELGHPDHVGRSALLGQDRFHVVSMGPFDVIPLPVAATPASASPAAEAPRLAPDPDRQEARVSQGSAQGLPPDAIAPRDGRSGLAIQVRQANGRPLPAWLSFDARTGHFSGSPPQDLDETLRLELTVRDPAGNRSVSQLELKVGPPAQQASPDRPHAPSVLGKEALQQQFRQHGQQAFENQVAQWLQSEELTG